MKRERGKRKEGEKIVVVGILICLWEVGYVICSRRVLGREREVGNGKG